MIHNKKVVAIVLAGGKGKRMGTQISKQYLELKGHPLLFYSLETFEHSLADEIVLVVASGEEDYVKREIVEKYQLTKVVKIVTGGRERYDSVYHGLCAVEDADIVMIHDGARPFLSEKMIYKAAEAASLYGACVVGVKVKDTIKVSDENNNITETPDRSRLWQVQTPQSFKFSYIKEAYKTVLEKGEKNITDDAMIWEACRKESVKLIEGEYFNIKITTPEDMIFGEAILENIEKNEKSC